MAENEERRGGLPGALLWLPVGGVALGQRFVLPGASIADLALMAFSAIALLHLLREARRHGRPRLPAWTKWLLALWTWAAVGGVAHLVLDTEAFSFREFSKSLAKLSFYAPAAVVLTLALARVRPREAGRVVTGAFAAAGAVAIAIYVAMLCGVPLPYQALWGHGPHAAYFDELRWFGAAGSGPVFLRAQGLASEPSRLGYLQAMALGYLLLGRPAEPARPDLRLVLIVLSALLSFSLTGYALLLPILGLAALLRWRGGIRPGRRGLWAAAAVMVLLLPLAPTLYRVVAVRAVGAATGSGDVSSRLRLTGTWEMTWRLLETNPVLGVGLGNYDVMARELQAFIFAGHFGDEQSQGWNAFAYVLATTGVPGLLLLAALLASALRQRGWLFLPFALGMLADSTILGTAFWVFLALYTSPEPSS
jgi:hypothetical protein